jgi:hypothetical protein
MIPGLSESNGGRIRNNFQIRTLAKQVGMILHGLDVVHLAPDLRHAGAEVCGQVIEPHLLELKSGIGNGLQGGFQCLEVAAQDVRPWWMLWGGLVDCGPYVERGRLHDAGHPPGPQGETAVAVAVLNRMIRVAKSTSMHRT